MPILGLGLGLHRAFMGSGLDSDVLAFAAESGATDLDGLNDLVKYLKAESLYSNFVIYPMKSAQNAGSGSTVYSLGGKTTNGMTLVNSPTWGADSVSFDGINQHGSIADFIGSETLSVFLCADITDSAIDADWVNQYGAAGDNRSWRMFQEGGVVGDPLALIRSSDGTSSNLEFYAGTKLGLGVSTTFVASWINGAGRNLWSNKTEISLSYLSGTPQTSRSNEAVDIKLAALGAGHDNPTEMDAAALAFIGTALTTLQRETITDFINAL